MTREEAISDNRYELIKKYKQQLIEATNIESREDEMKVIDNILFRFWQIGWLDRLEGVCFDEWCTDCKEYDTEKKCCPRFNRVIRGALKREPSEDGTLEVKVEDATKIGRVLISDDKHRGGLYYPDEDEPQGDLISRTEAYRRITELSRDLLNDDCINIGNASEYLRIIRELPSADRPRDGDLISRQAAIDALYDKGSSMTAWGELLAMKWSDIQKCIEQLPSADRPTDGDLISRADAIDALGEEPPVWCDEEYEIAERNQWREDVEAIKSVPSADRPRGEWIEETSWKYKKGGRNSDMKEVLGTEWMTMTRQRCSECNMVTMVDDSILYKYCPHCGADMRGGEDK